MEKKQFSQREINHYVHYIIQLGLFLGLFVTNCPLMKAYFLFVVILPLHWLTNNDKCFISQFDYGNADGAYTMNTLSLVGIKNMPSPFAISAFYYVYALFLIGFTYYKIKKYCGNPF